MRTRFGLLLAVCAGCGDNRAAAVDAPGNPDAVPVDSPDAAPDAPTASALEVTPIDLGLTTALVAKTGTATVTNPGDVAVAITAIATTGRELAVDATTCGANLDPHSSCTVTVRMLGATLGDHAGTLRVTASSGVATATIAASVGGEIDVALPAGGMVGTGRVTSTPAGIDCASTGPDVMPVHCPGAVFTGPVTLVAQPDPGFVFAGWIVPGCGASPSCVVTPGLDPVNVSAFFLPAGFHVVIVASGGTAPVDAYVSASSAGVGFVEATCAAPCALPVPVGWTMQIGGSTTSTYVGMSGACTTTTTTCVFTPAADATVTITADRAPNETASLVLPVSVRGVAVDSQGAYVIATASSVRKLDAANNLVWAIAAASLPQLGVSADDHVTTLIGTQLTRWTPDGVAEWQVDVPTPAVIRVARDGSIALGTAGAVTVFGADGTMRWQQPLSYWVGLDFEANGDLVVVEIVNIAGTAVRYAADGSLVGTIAMNMCDETGAYAIAHEANGGVACSNVGQDVNLERWTATGTLGFADDSLVSAIAGTHTWLAAGDDGGLWWVHEQLHEVGYPIGFVVHHFDAANVETQLVRGLLHEDLPLLMPHGCDPADVRAVVGAGVVVGGYYVGYAASGFVQVFASR